MPFGTTNRLIDDRLAKTMMLDPTKLARSIQKHSNARSFSVAGVLVCAFGGNLAFVALLPDEHLGMVIATLAIAGLISGAAASNCTAKIYATINADPGLGFLSSLTLLLFVFEQLLAQLLVLAAVAFESIWPTGISWYQLSLLAIAASSGTVVAFVKFKDRWFVLLNIFRILATLARVGLILWLAYSDEVDLIVPVVIVTFAMPSFFALSATLIVARKHSGNGRRAPLAPWRTLREYLLGVPVAASRAFVNQGLIVVSVALLNASDLRMFRFLLIPKDVISRLFNAALPLVFDQLYAYQPDWKRLAAIGLGALAIASIWYAVGAYLFSFGAGALLAFAIFMALNMMVYSFLPVVWRAIYRNQASRNTAVVLTSVSVFGTLFWSFQPRSVAGILYVMCVYLTCYLVGTFMMARSERVEQG